MSKPRQVLKGKTRMLTRRVLERRFFLKPSKEVNQLIEYLLAVGCARYGIELIAVYFASNHFHLIIYDPEGRYPAFLQWFDGLVARALNALYERKDRFWDVQQANAPELADAAAVLDRACYTLGNPVKDGLVPHGREWPGIRSTPQSCLLPPKVVHKPDFYFSRDPRSPMPDSAELTFHVPPEFKHLGPEAWAKHFAEQLGRFEANAREELAKEGRSFIGVRQIKRERIESRATSDEPRGSGEVLHPIVIARDSAARLAVIKRHLEFERKYKVARRRMLAQEQGVLFPYGTYKYHVVLGLPCQPPP